LAVAQVPAHEPRRQRRKGLRQVGRAAVGLVVVQSIGHEATPENVSRVGGYPTPLFDGFSLPRFSQSNAKVRPGGFRLPPVDEAASFANAADVAGSFVYEQRRWNALVIGDSLSPKAQRSYNATSGPSGVTVAESTRDDAWRTARSKSSALTWAPPSRPSPRSTIMASR